MDGSVIVRAALVQLAGVAVLSLALVLATDHAFFEQWGFVAGPVAWLVCALITAAVLGLPPTAVVAGAVLAGIPSGLLTLAGLHWPGALLAIVLFALWCGRAARDPRITEDVI